MEEKESKQYSREEFLKLDPDEVARKFKTALGVKDIGYMDLLLEHERFHLVYPSAHITEFPEHFLVLIQFVRLDLQTDFFTQYKKVQVPKTRGGGLEWKSVTRYAVTWELTRKLRHAAGIDWIEATSGVVHREFDSRGFLARIEYQATGVLLMLDGSKRSSTSTKHLDFFELEHQARQLSDERGCNKKTGETWDSPRQKAFNKISRQRQYAHELVESGAKRRAILDLLGIPAEYSEEIVNKIWVVPKLQLKLDFDNPIHAQALIMSQIQSENSLYFSAAAHAAKRPALPAGKRPALIESSGGQEVEVIPHDLQVEPRTEQAPMDGAPEQAGAPGSKGESGAGQASFPPNPHEEIPAADATRLDGQKPLQKNGKWELYKATEPVGNCAKCEDEIKPDRRFWFHSGMKMNFCASCGLDKQETERTDKIKP